MNRQFGDLLEAIKPHASKVIELEGFASGLVKGFPFRIFVEGKGAYLCIRDENAKGHMWSAFYRPEDVEEWAKNH